MEKQAAIAIAHNDVPQDSFRLIRLDATVDDFAADVRAGLTANPKRLSPKYFYDDLGSSLFEAICLLPEYYVTRAESEILRAHAAEIVATFAPCDRIVELGSGSARKTRLLLDAILQTQQEIEYVPIDVDAGILERSGREIMAEYPGVSVTAICGDFAEPSHALAELPPSSARTAILFLGSSIGNLEPHDALAMLRNLRGALRTNDVLFLGADLRKAKSILEPAYDDALGVTAAFNRNVLQRINRELGGHFDLPTFRHKAVYDETLGRVEMHLVSRIAQSVRVDALDLDVTFAVDESIHTENSHKYDEPSLARLADESDFTVGTSWTDSNGYFADLVLVAR